MAEGADCYSRNFPWLGKTKQENRGQNVLHFNPETGLKVLKDEVFSHIIELVGIGTPTGHTQLAMLLK